MNRLCKSSMAQFSYFVLWNDKTCTCRSMCVCSIILKSIQANVRSKGLSQFTKYIQVKIGPIGLGRDLILSIQEVLSWWLNCVCICFLKGGLSLIMYAPKGRGVKLPIHSYCELHAKKRQGGGSK